MKRLADRCRSCRVNVIVAFSVFSMWLAFATPASALTQAKPLSLLVFQERANQICRIFDAKLRALPLGSVDRPPSTIEMNRWAEVVRAQEAKLRTLVPPIALRAKYAAMLFSMQGVPATGIAYADAVRAGNSRLVKMYNAKGQQAFTKRRGLAQQLGLRDCAKQ